MRPSPSPIFGSTASGANGDEVPEAALQPGASRRLQIGVAVLCLAVVAMLWTLALVTISRDFRQEEEAQRRVTESLLRAFAEQTERTVNLVDQTLRVVKRQYEAGQPVDLRALLEGATNRLLFRNLTIVDEQGRMVLSTFVTNDPKVNATQRDYFEFHRTDTSEALYVGRTVTGRFVGKTIIPFTMRLNHADGSFAGVVVAAMDPAYFSDFYDVFQLGPRDFIGFMGTDGYTRAGREEGAPPGDGREDRRRSVVLQRAMESSFAVFRARSPVDGVDRLMAVKRIAPYPLIVATGVATDNIFEAPRKRQRALLGVVGAATVLVLALGLLLYRAVMALERRTAASDNASRMKSEFIAHMSHELRTPLHGILGFSEYLERRLKNPLERESAALIHKSGTHLLSIVDSILDLAKIEAGKLELDLEDVDVAALVEGLAANHRVVTERKGVPLEVEIAPSARGLWRCDRVRLSSMLSNLLDNAAKFTERGRVRLCCDASGEGWVRIVVSDTGPGVSEADQARIFERFRQGETFVTRRHGGTGLGLALVREFARLMGGSIELESQPGHGATFTLYLPLPRVRESHATSLEAAA